VQYIFLHLSLDWFVHLLLIFHESNLGTNNFSPTTLGSVYTADGMADILAMLASLIRLITGGGSRIIFTWSKDESSANVPITFSLTCAFLGLIFYL